MRGLSKALVGGALLATIALVLGGPATSQRQDKSVIERAARGELKPAVLTTTKVENGKTVTVKKVLPFISDGTVAAAREVLGEDRAASLKSLRSLAAASVAPTDLGTANNTNGCAGRATNGNKRVNQDCTYRRNAEQEIIYNPADPDNLIAGLNDSRVGFNQCSIEFSTDNGQHWGDMIPPFRQKFNDPSRQEPTPTDPNRHTLRGGPGTNHTYDFGSDPTVAFDSRGRAYFSCLGLDIADNGNMVYIVQSPAGAAGSFYRNIAQFSRLFIAAEDNNPTAFHDKQFIVADFFTGSPNRDNVYVTWTVFDFTCGPDSDAYCRSPIFGSMMTGASNTWSTPEEISGAAPFCQFGNAFDPTQPANACNFDQGSEPTVLPNGDLVVTFTNGNVSGFDDQQLVVRCRPTGSSPAGTARLNCGNPIKIADAGVNTAPRCPQIQLRLCIPGPFIRTNDFPRTQVNTDNGRLYTTWQTYDGFGEWTVVMSRSTDGGLNWTQPVRVNPDSGLDHYFAAIDIAEIGSDDRVGVGYFRSQTATPAANSQALCEAIFGAGFQCPFGLFILGQGGAGAGQSDFVLAGGTNLDVPYEFKVLSPVFPPPNGIQATFNGDYNGLTINRAADAHPIWSDTRSVDPFAPLNGVVNDEDGYTDNVGLPNGRARPSVGEVGRR